MKSFLFILLLTVISSLTYAQSIRERLDDIEDQIIQDRIDRLVDKLIENNQKLQANQNSYLREIDRLILNSPCNVTWVDGKFKKWTPPTNSYTAFLFSKTNSLIFVPNNFVNNLTDGGKDNFARNIVLQNLQSIRKLCPNIPVDLLVK